MRTARLPTSLESSGMLAFRKGRTKGRRGKFVTSCNTWWKSDTEIVPAWKKEKEKRGKSAKEEEIEINQ